MTDRDNDPLKDWQTTCGEPEIEVAWNPARRRWEPIYPEDEGYDEAARITMYWARSLGRYVTIPS